MNVLKLAMQIGNNPHFYKRHKCGSAGNDQGFVTACKKLFGAPVQ